MTRRKATETEEQSVVYVIYSDSHQRQHIGITDNTEEILDMHNAGRVLSTSPYKPWRMIHTEDVESRPAAKKRETFLKSSAGRAWILRTYKV
ncbi:MAG: GIY-YIG nuclease family protein [Flavobacteriales bacterium]|nr:GIY-YIG nuclease family protein [Flavobacteriales bacterium]